MSAFRLQATASRSIRSLPAFTAPARGARLYSSHVNDGTPETIEKEKQRNLSGNQDSSAPHKEHAPGWNEHLASHSEAAVKADQAGPAGKPGKDLQDKTVQHTRKHHDQ